MWPHSLQAGASPIMSPSTSWTVVTEFAVTSATSKTSDSCIFVTNWTSWLLLIDWSIFVLFVGSTSWISVDESTVSWTGVAGASWTGVAGASWTGVAGASWTGSSISLGGFCTMSVRFKYSRPSALKT